MAYPAFVTCLNALLDAQRALKAVVANTCAPPGIYVVDQDGTDGIVRNDALWVPAWERASALWFNDGHDGPRYGLVSINDELEHHILTLNKAKRAFRDEIQAMQRTNRGRADALMMSLNKELGRRDGPVGEALRNNGAQTLSLTDCYREIRILPGIPRKFSWTWQTRALRIQVISRAEALKLVRGARYADTWKTKHEALITDPWYARISKANDALHANVAYSRHPDKKPRESLAVSGLVCIKGDWPADLQVNYVSSEEHKQRRAEKSVRSESEQERTDQTIERSVFIEELALYRYLPGKGPKGKSL